MRNCIVLGCGRSGTSLLTNALVASGYYAGADLIPGNGFNPEGYFEDFDIARINEAIIAAMLPRDLPAAARLRQLSPDLHRRLPLYRHRTAVSQHWLAVPSLRRTARVNEALLDRMKRHTHNVPYSLKDPRFSFAMPAWRPALQPDTVFICVFRDPRAVASSIVANAAGEDYLRSLSVNRRHAMHIWLRCYQHIVRMPQRSERWLFVGHHQLLDGSGFVRVGQAVEAAIAGDAVRPDLSTSTRAGGMPRAVRQMFDQLLALSHEN